MIFRMSLLWSFIVIVLGVNRPSDMNVKSNKLMLNDCYIKVWTNPSLRQNGLSLGFLCRGSRSFFTSALSKAELQTPKRSVQISFLKHFRCGSSKEAVLINKSNTFNSNNIMVTSSVEVIF